MVAMETTRDTTRTRSRDVHAALVDAAEAVLLREGPAALTVRAVAQEAGVAPMGVYNRFGSKDGLLEALLVRGFTLFREALLAGREADPMSRMRACGGRYREFALTHPRYYELMFSYDAPLARQSVELQEAGAAAFGVLVDEVSAAMAAGAIAEGDPREVAQLVWSALHGAVALELGARTMAADPAASYRALLDLVLGGLATPGRSG
jgi:AcrR family transcriptional regulator